MLSSAATLIRDWCRPSEQLLTVLRRSNELQLVTVWTGNGAVMKLKRQTGDARRLGAKVYYTAGFQDLITSIVLRRKFHLATVLQDLAALWAPDNRATLLFGRQVKESICELVEHVFASPESAVVAMRKRVLDAAVANGEFKCISHDATFKAAFAIIGQAPMSQRAGEVHALHTFVAQSGLCTGRSGQRTEGEDDFAQALADLLPHDAISQVEYLLSDSPSEYFLRHLPNCRGVAEDPVHLSMRIDGCTNERRTALSWRVLKLHKKFQCPAPPDWDIYHGEHKRIPEWDNVRPGRVFTDAQLAAYLEKPFTGVREYIGALRRIALMYPSTLARKDLKGVSVLEHLQRAGSHFYYTQNVAVFTRLHPDVLKSTMRNEAIHRQVKDWGRCVYQCHRERIVLGGKIFGIYKALAHSCVQGTVVLREGWRISRFPMRGWSRWGGRRVAPHRRCIGDAAQI